MFNLDTLHTKSCHLCRRQTQVELDVVAIIFFLPQISRASLCIRNVNTVAFFSSLLHNVRIQTQTMTVDKQHPFSHIGYRLISAYCCNRLIRHSKPHRSHMCCHKMLYFRYVCYSDFFFPPVAQQTGASLPASVT